MPMTDSGEPGKAPPAADAEPIRSHHNHYNVSQSDSITNWLMWEKNRAFQTANGGLYMRLIFSILAILWPTSINAAPSKPSVADQIRHPRGQQVAGGNLYDHVSVDRPAADLQYALLLKSPLAFSKTPPKARTLGGCFFVYLSGRQVYASPGLI
jgi:hypothetical protein